ncbi:hypothetical protein [Pseudonocardia xishanensis]|uniref:Uncharacterized protein n=1 Tax=Pseudonocardia xishanensis TaxID=630995 RepID=A0ABP8RZ53_9PSEU
MSDDRSFMDKVLGRDEPARDDTGPVDTHDRRADSAVDTPAPRSPQDGPTSEDARDPGYDRPVDGTQDQRQAQRMRPADAPVDVRRDAEVDGGRERLHDQRQDAGGGTQGFRDGHQAADGSPTTGVTDTRPTSGAHATDDRRGSEWSEPGTGHGDGHDRVDHGTGHGRDGAHVGAHDQVGAHDRNGHGPDGSRDHGTSLVATDRAEEYRRRWETLKAGFVDEPRGAVKEADELVGRVLDDVAQLFARQRSELEADLRDEQASTEDLRQALGRYRSFFDRLLTV